jgi:hypothetical protein
VATPGAKFGMTDTIGFVESTGRGGEDHLAADGPARELVRELAAQVREADRSSSSGEPKRITSSRARGAATRDRS